MFVYKDFLNTNKIVVKNIKLTGWCVVDFFVFVF